MNIDARLAEITSTQHGAISLEQLRQLGVTRAQLRSRAARGQLARGAPRAYIVAGVPSTWRQHLWVAQLHAGEQSVISHEAAARLHNCTAIEEAVVLTVPTGRRRLSPQFRWHRLDDLTPGDIVEIDGLRVTAPARTMVDLASVVLLPRLRTLLHDAKNDGLVSLDEVEAALKRTRRRGKRGVAKLEKALDALGPGDELPRSALEALLDEMIELAGLPAPLHEHPLPSDGPITGLVDRYFPDALLIVEGDGRKWHTREADFARDRNRDNAAAEVGVATMRFTWKHLTDDIHATARQLQRVYDMRVRQLGGLQPR